MAKCKFQTENAKKEAIRQFLKAYGDDLPEDAIEKAVSDDLIDHFALECDPEKPSKIISGITYVNNDWYLCTAHYLATEPKFRGRGLGTKVTQDMLAKADDACLVFAADITYDNLPSQKIFMNEGFQPVSRFCWGENKKPADILHYVKYPPVSGKCHINKV